MAPEREASGGAWRSKAYGGIDVSYKPRLDGGGSRFGQDFLRVVAGTTGRVSSLLEWCSGPGFIGFSLLGHGFADSLTVADVNPDAQRACQRTIDLNGLSGRATAVTSDCFDALPAGDRWDLIVANPPHVSAVELRPSWGPAQLYRDPGFGSHAKFFASVSERLADGGSVILQEHSGASSPTDFDAMICANGLRLVTTLDCLGLIPTSRPIRPSDLPLWCADLPVTTALYFLRRIYYLWLMKADDAYFQAAG